MSADSSAFFDPSGPSLSQPRPMKPLEGSTNGIYELYLTEPE